MINSRVLWILIGVSVFSILLLVKLFDVQILKSDESFFFAKQQQNKTENIQAERGLIYDRNNVLLVYNRNDISFYLDRQIVRKTNRAKAAANLASLFKNNTSFFLKIIRADTTTICVEKKAPNEKKILAKNLKISGLYAKDDPTRIYHYNSLASHIIGYVDNNFFGMDGIENSFNSILKGEDGVRIVERSRSGRMITISEEETKPAVPGLNVQLTIDKKLQVILEEELKNGVSKYKASSGVGIIMNPNNGEILALANVDDFNPNNYSEYDDFQRRNRCITDTYEPGSTFKSIALATLLENDLCSEDEIVDVENGQYKFMGRIIRDAHKFSKLSVKGIFEQSSNIGMSKLSQRIDSETLYKFLRSFGFGTTTGVELPGEVRGSLCKPSEISALTKSSISRGYGISVTPLQLAAAYCALVNGGVLYQPQIVRRLLTPEGEIKFEFKPREVRRTIAQKTSERMKSLLESVVKNGTGKNAKSDFVDIGGKTGTSKILENGKYSESNYNSSFVGFFPIENPQVVCFILLNSPKVGGYGGLVAAPIFKEVTSRMLTSLNESYHNDLKEPYQGDEKVKFIKTKNIYEDKTTILKNIKHDIGAKQNSVSVNTMPDLKNYTLREAIVLMTKLGINYQISGSGKITSQSILPGTKIKKGVVCKITCSETQNNVFVN